MSRRRARVDLRIVVPVIIVALLALFHLAQQRDPCAVPVGEPLPLDAVHPHFPQHRQALQMAHRMIDEGAERVLVLEQTTKAWGQCRTTIMGRSDERLGIIASVSCRDLVGAAERGWTRPATFDQLWGRLEELGTFDLPPSPGRPSAPDGTWYLLLALDGQTERETAVYHPFFCPADEQLAPYRAAIEAVIGTAYPRSIVATPSPAPRSP